MEHHLLKKIITLSVLSPYEGGYSMAQMIFNQEEVISGAIFELRRRMHLNVNEALMMAYPINIRKTYLKSCT